MPVWFDAESLEWADMPEAAVFVSEALSPRAARVHDLAAAARAHEVEGVHDLRVASRRLRAALRACRPLVLPGRLDAAAETARAITRALGRPRELDVMLGMLAEEEARAAGPWREAAHGIALALHARRANACADCEAAADLAEQLALPALAAPDLAPDADVAGYARAELARGQRRLRKAHRRWRKRARPEDLHRVRVALKKVRYVCELFAPWCPALAEAVDAIKEAQELLGHWNDCRVLLAELADLPVDAAGAAPLALVQRTFANRAEEYLLGFGLLVAEGVGGKD